MKPHNTSCTTTPFDIWWRSAVYLLGQILSTFLICPVMVLMYRSPFEKRFAAGKVWVRFNLWVLKTVCGLRFQVRGQENIPRQSGGLIICKHQSAYETLALQVIFPSVVFILKQELLRIPVWGWAMAMLEPIAIDREAKSRALKQILKEGVARIRSGRWVVLFPEGTRVAPGQRGRYGTSGGLLAHRAGCPVIPVAHNAGEFWAKNGFFKYPGTIRIEIGPVLDGATLTATEINRLSEEWIEARMAEISPVRAPKAE